MRSRYTAYAMGHIDYIAATMKEKARLSFDSDDAKAWSQQVKWLTLEVQHYSLSDENHGTVTFIATYMENGHLCTMKESSQFKRLDGRWYYTDGENQSNAKKIGLNQTCPCGSGKKYKRCCRC